MDTLLSDIEALDTPIIDTAKRLFDTCNASLYPCDVVAVSVADRALSLSGGFVVLMKNGGYIPAAGVLRMQLDNVLRFHGMMTSPDPHDVANQVINGAALNELKDANGHKMTDRTLRKCVSAEHPWVDHVYQLSSVYIHFSNEHVLHVLQRSPVNGQGQRDLAIGSEDAYLRPEQRADLARTFVTVTRQVIDSLALWIERRSIVCSEEELRERWPNAA